jgi:hypothetical protein
MLSGGCRLGKATFAGTHGNGRDASIPAVRGATIEPLESTLKRHSSAAPVDSRGGPEAVIRPRLLVLLADRLTSIRLAATSPL